MGSFRMYESDLCAAGTDTWFLVDQTGTFFLEICQGSLKIIYAQGDMLDAATADRAERVGGVAGGCAARDRRR